MKKLLISLFILIFNTLLFSQNTLNKNVEFFEGEIWPCKLKVYGYGDYNKYLYLSLNDCYDNLRNPYSFKIKSERVIYINFFTDVNIITKSIEISKKTYYRKKNEHLSDKKFYTEDDYVNFRLDSNIIIYKPLVYDYNKYYKKEVKNIYQNFNVNDKFCEVQFDYYAENGYKIGISRYYYKYNLTNNQPLKTLVDRNFDSIISKNKELDSIQYRKDFIKDSIQYRKDFIKDSICYNQIFHLKIKITEERLRLEKEKEEERLRLEKEMKLNKKTNRRFLIIVGTIFFGIITTFSYL